MKITSLNCFRTPLAHIPLRIKNIVLADDHGVIEGELQAENGEVYAIRDGIVDFTYPEQLLAADAETITNYDQKASLYDTGLNWLFESFYEDELTVRTKMIDLLDIKHNARVLEIGAGTGRDSLLIAERLSSIGELQLQDLSKNMLELCQKKIGKNPIPHVDYTLSNASHLPYCSQYFDATYHFGGLNTFAEKQLAISEMARVTKVGGRVVFGDEGVPPWLKETEFGKILINANPLYKHTPPLDYLPPCARNVNLSWIIGGAFYIISFDIAEGSPPINLDLAIPGKGDSLRARYNTANLQKQMSAIDL